MEIPAAIICIQKSGNECELIAIDQNDALDVEDSRRTEAKMIRSQKHDFQIETRQR